MTSKRFFTRIPVLNRHMKYLVLALFVLVGCENEDAAYCGAINHMQGPIVLKAKSENCDIVLVDAKGLVIGIPGKYSVARAVCKSMEKGDTLAVKDFHLGRRISP